MCLVKTITQFTFEHSLSDELMLGKLIGKHTVKLNCVHLDQGFSTCGPRTPGVLGQLPGGPRATPKKLQTRRILTKRNTGHINVVGTGYNVQN